MFYSLVEIQQLVSLLGHCKYFHDSCVPLAAVSLMLQYISYHLAQHPDVLSRLNKEIESKLNGRTDFTRDDLKKLGYLENVLKESESFTSLRLFVIYLAGCIDGLTIL